MYRKQSEILDRKKTGLLKKVKANLENYDLDLIDVIECLEDATLYEYFPKELMEMCDVVMDSSKNLTKNIIKPKDRTPEQRRLYKAYYLAKKIKEFIPYRFFFVAPIGQTKTFYARMGEHKEVWDKANEYCKNEFHGSVSSIICLTKDGVDIGGLSNLEAMFTPKDIDSKYHSVRASDLIEGYVYKNEDICGCGYNKSECDCKVEEDE